MRAFLPTLRQLAYLVALDEHRHFGRAADAMAVSQSSLSSGLKDLETLLGASLVERSRRRIHFTTLGVEVVERARELLRQADQIAALAQSCGEPLSGELHLSVIPTIAPFLLPRLLQTLRRDWPKLDLVLREETSAAACEALHRGHIDCALLALPYDCGSVSSLDLFEDPLRLALPSDHPLAERDVLEGSDIEPARLLLLEDGHCLKDHALRQCGTSADQTQSAMLGTSLHTLVQMVAGGLGATFIPDMAVRSGLGVDAAIKILPIRAEGGRDATRRIALVWRKGSPREHDFKLLAEEIRKAAGAA